ncbi:hypothetical protein NQ314_019934 [Rhamnusium bicolor]|uniref:Nucleolus and neural progenitor protein-like N-terminal domain-containing protein n=1 Tax=Rhamnusium bicolor TaxID=1586634 RepID=A0AAV8WMB1_9CUCU|nr:hypothetical protein NQ314_019934 [Rhamnusium bicolor]
MNLWNVKDLPAPPINTYKAVNKKIDIQHLFNVFREGETFFEDDKFMYAEFTVLSRIVYRMKQKFRSAKDFKALQKINKALDNYFNMDILRNLKNFMHLIPSRYKDETYLPTKNLLDYILIRLQGLVKLMERIIETCKIAAYLLDKRIHTGHFWKIAFIIFSIVSRIYVLAKYSAKFSCEFYSKLYPFSSQLSNISEWYPHYTLPKDLKEWMNVDWLEVDDEIQIVEVPTDIPDIIQFFDLVDDDDDEVQFCNEYVMIKDDADDTETEKTMEKMGNMNFKDLWELRGFDAKEDVESCTSKNNINSDINVLSETDKSDTTVISDNSVQSYNDDIIDIDSDHSNNLSKKENPIVITDVDEETIPDTPLVVTKKRKKTKKSVKKLDVDEETIPDTPLVVTKKRKKTKKNVKKLDVDEETIPDTLDKDIITISDTSFMETMNKNQMKVTKKRKKTKKSVKKLEVEENQNNDFDNIVSDKDDIITISDTSFMETMNKNQMKKMKKKKKSKSTQNIGHQCCVPSGSTITNTFSNNRKRKLESEGEDLKEAKRLKKRLKRKGRKQKLKFSKNKPKG